MILVKLYLYQPSVVNLSNYSPFCTDVGIRFVHVQLTPAYNAVFYERNNTTIPGTRN